MKIRIEILDSSELEELITLLTDKYEVLNVSGF